jgi:hypothetical protein
LGEEELAARNKAVSQANFRAGGLDTLISTRAKQLKDEPPPPDLQRTQAALRDARTRSAMAAGSRH